MMRQSICARAGQCRGSPTKLTFLGRINWVCIPPESRTSREPFLAINHTNLMSGQHFAILGDDKSQPFSFSSATKHSLLGFFFVSKNLFLLKSQFSEKKPLVHQRGTVRATYSTPTEDVKPRMHLKHSASHPDVFLRHKSGCSTAFEKVVLEACAKCPYSSVPEERSCGHTAEGRWRAGGTGWIFACRKQTSQAQQCQLCTGTEVWGHFNLPAPQRSPPGSPPAHTSAPATSGLPQESLLGLHAI